MNFGSMNFIRQRALSGELLSGCFLNLGSSLTVEMAGQVGFDFLLIDLEHGSGDQEALVHQLQAASATPAAPLVRIAWNEPWRFKRVLDAGAMGVMIPWVNDAEEARAAAAAMRYFPDGIRGAAVLNRGSSFGLHFEEYFTQANDNLTTVVQIETREALDNAAEIAAVPGVDVLFVGPFDLSISLGLRGQFEHPDFIAALDRVASAAKDAGKAAGILLQQQDQVADLVERGYTFICLGSDGGLVANGMRSNSAALTAFKR
jgi:4-hydroxy-2-oxoheptanedioate aldolase